jgi:thioredoxin-related protein
MKKILIIILFLVLLFIGYSISVTPSYNAIDISHALEEASVSLKNNQDIVVFKRYTCLL